MEEDTRDNLIQNMRGIENQPYSEVYPAQWDEVFAPAGQV
jgi:hypothetical protein